MYAPKANETKGIILDIHANMVSGSRDINLQEDLGIDIESLPKGAKKVWKEDIYPKSFLGSYKEIKRNAEANLCEWGTHCELGYFHTRRKAVEVLDKLVSAKANWEAQMARDENHFEAVKDQRLDQIRLEAEKEGIAETDIDRLVDAVKALQPTWEEIESKFGFKFTCQPIHLDEQEFDTDFYAAQQQSVTAIHDSVMGSMVKEVCAAAVSIHKNLLTMESSKSSASDFRIHGRTHDKLIDLNEKLHELSFMHDNLRLLSEDLHRFLEQFKSQHGKALRGTSYAVFKDAIVALVDQHEVSMKLRQGIPFLIDLDLKARQTAIEAQIEAEITSEIIPAETVEIEATLVAEIEDEVEEIVESVPVQAEDPAPKSQMDILNWM